LGYTTLQQRLQQKAHKLLLDVLKFLIKFISVAEAASDVGWFVHARGNSICGKRKRLQQRVYTLQNQTLITNHLS
jgi:hypothetical protein